MTILLTRGDVAALLSLDDCIAAVEAAFRIHAEGRSLGPAMLSVYPPGGGFHVKAAGLAAGSQPGHSYFAVKVNGNFFDNARRGLPNIQGIVVLCDAGTGAPLAVMDSIEITVLRTGAATAVAARYLARPDSRIATICGCGNQGRIQLRALARVFALQGAFAWDADPQCAHRFAAQMSAELGFGIDPVENDLRRAVRRSDICVTATPSRRWFLGPGDVPPGMFIAAVGADSPDKQELDPRLLASAKVVADVLGQCAELGEIHHALSQGLMTKGDVHAELAEVIVGSKAGRESAGEVTIFDSTGTALQDVAAAAVVYEKAVGTGRGTAISFLALS